MEPMLKVTDLSVSYGHVEALRGVSIQVEQGQIVSIIGANGAAAAHHFRPCEAVERQGGVFGRTAAEKTEQNRGKRDCACAGGPQDFFRPDHPG